jgi:hypothetical protein
VQEQRLNLVVSFDGERTDISIDRRRAVGDLIRHALAAFDVAEDVTACHLAWGDKLYFSHYNIAGSDLADGAVLHLRLPL